MKADYIQAEACFNMAVAKLMRAKHYDSLQNAKSDVVDAKTAVVNGVDGAEKQLTAARTRRAAVSIALIKAAAKFRMTRHKFSLAFSRLEHAQAERNIRRL